MGLIRTVYRSQREPTERECRNCVHWDGDDRSWAARAGASGRCDCPTSRRRGKVTRATDTCDRYRWQGRGV